MNFLTFLHENIVHLDGGMGTLLQAKGLKPGELPERWNLTHPGVITGIHKAYYDAGADVVSTNTFGANPLKFSGEELEAIIKAALENAFQARSLCADGRERFVALDVGPLGRLLAPLGDLDFEEAVSAFATVVRIGASYGADLVFIETMNDSYETKAALLAAKENCDLPVMVSNAYGEDGKLMTGASPEAMAALLEGMGADAIGANCSLGPAQLRGVMERLLSCTSVPVLCKPNAGLPRSVEGVTTYDVSPEDFSREVASLVEAGVRVVGGCCGTTPEYIRLLSEKTKTLSPAPLTDKGLSVVSSYTHAVYLGGAPILIGERINPTGKKRLKQALLEGDISYILGEGVSQEEKGAHILDVNVGLPEIEEATLLPQVVAELQTVTNLPLQVDTADPAAMEAALRRYNGKPMVNSVSGKEESMAAVFPLVKKYGGLVVALTLDEGGIPTTAAGRVQVARKIIERAASYGISKKDLVFDTLAMTVSADPAAADVTLQALRQICQLGCHTSLGVSNISFGLPGRGAINGTFFALALENGLSAAILNPGSVDMMRTYYTFNALKGYDKNFATYLSVADSFTAEAKAVPKADREGTLEAATELSNAIIKGFKEKAGELTERLLETKEPLQVINEEIIPALDIVGVGYEKKKVYLPQLLMSAEAAKSAFEKIKARMAGSGQGGAKKGPVILATVQGDIHDIGKNIVRLLMENYGFDVHDLGKDVPPGRVVEEVVGTHAPLAGLSALMTTTVPAMEETIRELKKEAPWCKVLVGGAVLTKEYAQKIGADCYAKDAMESVRYAEGVVE